MIRSHCEAQKSALSSLFSLKCHELISDIELESDPDLSHS